jgi:hypothetical protein
MLDHKAGIEVCVEPSDSDQPYAEYKSPADHWPGYGSRYIVGPPGDHFKIRLIVHDKFQWEAYDALQVQHLVDRLPIPGSWESSVLVSQENVPNLLVLSNTRAPGGVFTDRIPLVFQYIDQRRGFASSSLSSRLGGEDKDRQGHISVKFRLGTYRAGRGFFSGRGEARNTFNQTDLIYTSTGKFTKENSFGGCSV